MSVDATRWAWKAPVKSATQRLILLSLADRAGEHHTCYPSLKRLAKDTVLNIKTVQKVISDLIEDGLVVDTGERKGFSKRVRVLQLVGVESREYTQNRDDSKIGNIPKKGIKDVPKIGMNNDPKIGMQNLTIEPNNESNNISEKFSFAVELKNLGANEQLVSDWLQVRKTKKAGNTKTALNNFMKQVEKSGLPLNTVLEICVVRSWQGFNVDWLKNVDLSEYQPKQQVQPEQSPQQFRGVTKKFKGM